MLSMGATELFPAHDAAAAPGTLKRGSARRRASVQNTGPDCAQVSQSMTIAPSEIWKNGVGARPLLLLLQAYATADYEQWASIRSVFNNTHNRVCAPSASGKPQGATFLHRTFTLCPTELPLTIDYEIMHRAPGGQWEDSRVQEFEMEDSLESDKKNLTMHIYTRYAFSEDSPHDANYGDDDFNDCVVMATLFARSSDARGNCGGNGSPYG